MSRLLTLCLAVILSACASGPPPPVEKPCNWSPEVIDGIYYLALIRLSDDTMVAQGAYAARITLGITIQEPGETMGHERIRELYATHTDTRIAVTGKPNVIGLRAISCVASFRP